MKYHWIHVSTGKTGSAEFDKEYTRKEALEIINTWNTPNVNLFWHYWLE